MSRTCWTAAPPALSRRQATRTALAQRREPPEVHDSSRLSWSPPERFGGCGHLSQALVGGAGLPVRTRRPAPLPPTAHTRANPLLSRVLRLVDQLLPADARGEAIHADVPAGQSLKCPLDLV